MKLEFSVVGKPPRKDGANSMWGKDEESSRVIALRQSALAAMQEAGMTACFRSYVQIQLDLYVPVGHLETVGDLDNFVTGICDGLQAIHPNGKPHEKFFEAENKAVDPKRPLVIQNDSKVISIRAAKHVRKDSTSFSYRVAVEEVEVV